MFEKVAKILADYKDADVSAITPESSFADLGFDSLDVIELLMKLEEDLGVTVEADETLKTVDDLLKRIEKGE